MTQTNQILELLQTNRWICTSEMYRLYMADPRRRLCDLKDKGYQLESRKCQQHGYHKGGSKEWRLMAEKPVSGQILASQRPYNPKVEEFLAKFAKPTQLSLKPTQVLTNNGKKIINEFWEF